MPTPIPPWPRRLLNALTLDYALVLIGLSIIHAAWPQRANVLAFTEIFAPYFFLPLAVLAPLACWRGPRAVRIGVGIAALVFLVRFPPHLIAAPAPPPGATQIETLTWNVYEGGREDQVYDVLMSSNAGLIALEETYTDWLEREPVLIAKYPYRQLLPPWNGDGVSGLALLSRYPIREQGVVDQPPNLWGHPDVMWARLDLGQGRTLRVLTAHPPPARFTQSPCPTRLCYDPSYRDAQLAAIHALVLGADDPAEPVLLLGDFNVSDQEPAYHDLAAGLHDAFAEAGTGIGNTWGPHKLMDRGLPLIRIDYQLTTPTLRPQRAWVDCTFRGSDHCRLHATFALSEK